LQDNWSMALTADIPKVSRVAGGGIVKLAQISGRPIYPVAVATSGRITLNNWDRSVINLPFSRGAIVAGEPIRVPPEADEAALEQARVAVEQGVNAATERAYAIVDRRSTNHG
ncbi:MAG: lysophospholipid acyltransferase family protein, partial [Xanthobacteraceae bacterium]